MFKLNVHFFHQVHHEKIEQPSPALPPSGVGAVSLASLLACDSHSDLLHKKEEKKRKGGKDTFFSEKQHYQIRD